VDDHAGGLIHDKEIGILVKDVQRDVLGAGAGGWFRRLLLDTEEIPVVNFVVIANGLSPKGDASRLDERLDLGA
jgi:hypothetical protein